MTLLDSIGVREGILIIISAWSLLALVFYVVRIYEDYQIRSFLTMETQGVDVYVSESDRIKYQRKLPLSKPYTPIGGVRYIPHWYLKEPLPRNVRPKSKGAVLVDVIDRTPELTNTQMESSGLQLMSESVREHRNLIIKDKKWKTVETKRNTSNYH